MNNLAAALILLLIIGFAAVYVIRAKKRGNKCIGCPESCHCTGDAGCGSCHGCMGCGENHN